MSISISGENNIAFLHIPKTAGTSIGEWLNNSKGSSVYREFVLHPKLSSFFSQQIVKPSFTFTVVRNPWDRMVSFYHWIKYLILNDPTSMIGRFWKYSNSSDSLPPFDQWLRDIDSFAWLPPSILWFRPSAQQTEWIDQPIDLIVRFENLEADLAPIRDLLSTSVPLPHRKRSNHYPYQQYYTDETRQIIAQRFQQDIDLFKYSF